MNTKLRSGLLSSKAVRNSESRNPLKNSVADFIDNLAQQYDALSVLHSTVDPDSTKTGHALKVKNAVIRSLDANGNRAVRLVEQLADHEKNLIFKAQEKAGLLRPLPESHLAELRSALRQMTLQDREKAISNAFNSGDVAVIRAVQEASSAILVGSHNLPLDQMLQSYIQQQNPDLERDLREVTELAERLDLVSDAFGKSVHGLRDTDLELKAEQHKQMTAEAMATLDPLCS